MKPGTLFLCFCCFCTSVLTAADVKHTAKERPPNGAPTNPVQDEIGKFNKTSQLIGSEVRNPENERLGQVRELMIDVNEGELVYVVLGTGGLLGVGDKLIALPPTALHPGTDQDFLILNADKAAMENAPGFAKGNWPATADPRFSGETAYTQRREERQQVNEAAGAERKPTQPELAKEPEIGATMYQIRASELLGMSVKNRENEKLGEIRDIAVDLHTGRVRYAVLSSGGFLGVGEKLYAVPMDAMDLAGPERAFVMNATKDTFKTARSFDRNQWPNTADQAFARRTLQFQSQFGEAAGARRTEGTAEFNLPASSAQGSGELTAADQRNTREELEVTQQIRRALVKDETLSLAAKNVTIVTKGNEVTVRGIVESTEEKQRIYEKVRQLAGGREVRDQLNVRNR